MSDLISKINDIFELKHVSKLGVHQDLKFLGHRLVKHHDNSISISLQQDYYLNMLKPFNLHHDNVRPVTTTCAEPPRIPPQDHLSAEDHRQYRQTVGQLIWASLIRPDLQYPAKTLTRHLQAPSSFDLKNLKHTLRYIKGSQHLRLVLGKDLHRHAGQPLDQLHPLDIKCFTDSDWAGDQETRKSTSGFLISILNTPLAFSSKTQGSIAQSSAEAELYAMASGVADAIFIKQLLSEIQEHIGIKTFDIPDHHPVTNKPVPAITVLTDSTSATSLVQKMGLNRRSKHIELKFLWLQDHHKNGVIKVKRVSSLENPADIFTKNVSASTLAKHLPACGLQELRVGEGDDNNHHIFHLLTDTKFRKGFHQVQAQAPSLHLPQEAEEQETDNIFDMDICMIETEDNTTTPLTTTTASTEKTAMQILAEVLQRKKQQQQKKNEQQQQQIQQQQVEQQVFREHHHPITSRLLTTTTSTTPTTTKEEPQEGYTSERGLSLSSLSSCPRRKRRTSSPGRVKEEEEGKREGERREEKEEHPHRPSSLAIVPIRRHQKRTIIVATSSLILFTSSLSSVLASSLPFAIKTIGSINHLYSKVSTISGHLKHLEGHLLSISSWSISNISCSSCWNISSSIKSIFSKMAAAPSIEASQMEILRTSLRMRSSRSSRTFIQQMLRHQHHQRGQHPSLTSSLPRAPSRQRRRQRSTSSTPSSMTS